MVDPGPLAPGFWGPPTSSIDWCEVNYQVTPYVAELWNTVSSLALVTAGLLGVLLNRRVLRARFLAAFGILVVVGLGSIAFHGTLHFELQMLDELPMLYLVTLMVYILVERGPRPRFGPWFPWALVGYALLLTALCAGNRGRVQFFVFQFSFGSLELWSLWQVYLLYRRSADPAQRRLFRLGASAYGLGVVLWWSDLHFCSFLRDWLPAHGAPDPQLHAWWHVLVSVGFYTLLLFLARSQAAPERRPA